MYLPKQKEAISMNVHFEVENRKELVKALEELTLEKAKYLGVPSCAYQIGSLTLSKNSSLSWGEEVNETAMERLLVALEEKGFVTKEGNLAEKMLKNMAAAEPANVETEPEMLDVNISLPKDIFTPETWENLNNLLAAKGRLIQKALGLEELPEVIEEEDRITFPWFKIKPSDNSLLEAYSKFVCALAKLVREQKRVNSKEKEVENEKYAFRCFLLRLGFIGKEYKEVRKTLLKNFTGSSAFKGGVDHAVSK
jgi:hypothetical protein